MYRFDPDLEFLGSLSNDELKGLADILIYDTSDKEKRHSETLSTSEEYKKYGDQYDKYWKRIAVEFQYFGGDSIVNTFRGSGVLYREILTDALDCLDSKIDTNLSVELLEREYLSILLPKAFEHFSEEQKRDFLNDVYNSVLEKNMKDFAQELLAKSKKASNEALDFLIKIIKNSAETVATELTKALTKEVCKQVAPIIASVILSYIGVRVASQATSSMAARGFMGGGSLAVGTFLGSILIVVLALTAVPMITGKALRVTMPACAVVSLLRISHS